MKAQGNESFHAQKYQQALDWYDQALMELQKWPQQSRLQRALIYSNKAAASLALQRPLQALKECMEGLRCDPTYTKGLLRLATCYLRMACFQGAFDAVKMAKEATLRQPPERHRTGMEQEIVKKESEIARVESDFAHVMHRLGFSTNGTVSSTSKASSGTSFSERKQLTLQESLNLIESVKVQVPHSESLCAAKQSVLLRHGSYEAMNSREGHGEGLYNGVGVVVPWRVWLRVQAEYFKGNHSHACAELKVLREEMQKIEHQLEQTADDSVDDDTAASRLAARRSLHRGDETTLDKALFSSRAGLERDASEEVNDAIAAVYEDSILVYQNVVLLPSTEEISSLHAKLDEAEQLRSQGNTAIGKGRYKEAVEAYTKAILLDGLSPALSAILHCNRAAAHQGLGNYALALADSCRAKALSPSYAKAHSRLAAVLSELGRHEAAADELRTALSCPSLTADSKKEYNNRLTAAQRAAAPRPRQSMYGYSSTGSKITCPPDHYKMLGVDTRCTAEEVRRAYKKLALLLHPDKSASSCRVAERLGSKGVLVAGPVKDAQERVREAATWLFKCLGEAQEVLGDDGKRREFEGSMTEWHNAGIGAVHGSSGHRNASHQHHHQQQQHFNNHFNQHYSSHYYTHDEFVARYGSRRRGSGGGGGGSRGQKANYYSYY